tara:strand:- start:54043 stop:54672 length:630 start_codon:yes stop_codon:yes gene_type:complete
VATGKIVKNREIVDDNRRVDFEVYELFKGSGLNSFIVFGENSPCGLSFEDGEEILVFAYENEGQIGVSFCARYFSLKDLKNYPMELEILRSLKANKISYSNTFSVETYGNEFFKKIESLNPSSDDPQFAIFEVVIDKLNFWVDVKVVEGFAKELDEQLLKLMEDSDWELEDYSGNPIPALSKFVLVIENSYDKNSGSFQLKEYNFRWFR